MENHPYNIDPKSPMILQIRNNITKNLKIDGKEENSISFTDTSENCCVGIVDMVNSTKISSSLSRHKFCKYYGVFINSMTSIARSYDAVVVKNIGDCILFYFPNFSSDTSDEYKKNCLECCFAMIEIHDYVNNLLKSEGLPLLDYRVSCDFGNILIAKCDTSVSNDIFGPSVNMCSKINHYAKKNSIVVGGDFYEIIKKYGEFKFKSLKGFEIGLQHNYPVYHVMRSKPSCSTIIKKIINSNDLSDDKKTHCALAAMAVEKAIVKLGVPKLDYVTRKLYDDYHLDLIDCYSTPIYLKNLLKDLYGNSYAVVVNLIGAELAHMSAEFSEFMTVLKQKN